MKKKSLIVCSLFCVLSMLLMLVSQLSAINVLADVSSPWILLTFDNASGANTGTSAIDATPVGTPVYSDKLLSDNGPSGKYVSIDSNNYLEMSGDAFKFGTDAFSLSTWVNFSPDTPINTTIRLFVTGVWGYNSPGFAVAVSKNVQNTIHFGTGVGSTGSNISWSWSSGSPDFFDSQWHQLVFVFDQPNKSIKTYLDGSLVATNNTTLTNLSAQTAFSTVGLGLFVLDDTLPTGAVPVSLDNIAIYKAALTQSDVTASYSENLFLGDVNKDSIADISDLVEIKQHLMQINMLVGSFLTAGDINSDGYISISDLLAVQQQILGIQLFEAQLNNPKMLYTFDTLDGGDSGFAYNNATVVGTPTYSDKSGTGPSGKYVSIDEDNYLKVAGSEFDFGTDAFSLSFWVNIPSNTPFETTIRLFQTGVWGDYTPGFATALTKNVQGTIHIATGVGSSSTEHSWSWSDPVADFFDSDWHHMAFVFDQPNDMYYVYLDSTLVVSKIVTATGLSASTSQSTVGLGVFLWNDSVTDTSCSLSLDDIAIYDRVLTSDEISDNYDEITSESDIYYIDSEYGCDNNSGKSTYRPWKSLTKINTTVFSENDHIYLKSGSDFVGQLKPQGSGTSGHPIVLTSYGGLIKPIINGCGVQPATVHLYNIQYWELNNLEITNYNDTVNIRSGILIDNEDAGILNHIYIKNMYIHDVNGSNIDSNWGVGRINGGIIVYTHGFITKSAFNDILIQGNNIKRVDRSGIFMYSTWNWRDTISEGNGSWFPSTNVVIRNNVLNNIGGDGIVTGVTDGPLVEYNLVTYSNIRSGKNNVAIWMWNSDNSVFQYNEAAYTQVREGDGEGFDIDFGGTNNIMQYNYSHDNMGGFILITSFASYSNNSAIVRYNISQNDRYKVFRVVGAATQDCYVYNNTIYLGASSNTEMIYSTGAEGDVGEAYFYNNIFMNLGTGGNCLTSGAIFDYNCFYAPNLTITLNDPHIITTDPMFVNSGNGDIGINTVDGYKLKTGSPCINAGRAIDNNGGKDYWGNIVPNGLTDIGANEK